MTGETQLRARRTRIKILRAIADRNGMAGFSDIKTSTGLSTGSIYYHLERMGSYVTKDAKHYMITEEGLQLLREVDQRYAGVVPPRKEEQAQPDSGGAEEAVRQARHWGVRQYAFVGILASIAIFAAAGMFTSWQPLAIMGASAGILASAAAAAAFAVLFLTWIRRSYPIIGHKGMMLSIFALAVVLAAVMAFSGLQFTGATPAYDNSMDALRSSYSMHWQIR